MEFKIFSFVCCLSIVYCKINVEEGPVYSPKDKELGYACQSGYKAIALMKEGEVIKNNEYELCGEAYCSKGIITYTPCGQEYVGPRCVLTGKDYAKPYPDCCGEVTCFD